MCRFGFSLLVASLVVVLPLAAGNTYGRLPLSFEPNHGQTDARVKFLSRASGYTLFVTAEEAVFAGRDGSVERMKLLGANRKPRFEPLDKQPGVSNYFLGNDPSKWRTNIANYGKIALRDVYPGIDLVFYGHQRQLEYDWVVAPGADPKQIRVKWEGPSQITKNASGDLVLSASLIQRKPVIVQEGRRIEGGYAVRGSEVAFELAQYDAAKPLVIDPVLAYSTYLGGRGQDAGRAIAVDGAGNAYVTGSTESTNFPTAYPLLADNGGGDEVFVAKINPAGSALVYSTYLGGSGNDFGFGIAVDGSGNAYVTGQTTSVNFPTFNPLQASNGGGPFGDAFVIKLNPAGSALVYATYLGGSGDEAGNGIAVDGRGNAYVTGLTSSANFPAANPLQGGYGGGLEDAFVTKINAAGSALVYSTYLGGSGRDIGNRIAVDGSGNAYVTGETSSANFPTASPIQGSYGGGLDDAFVTKIDAAGSTLVYSTYLGGSGDDAGNDIAVDGAGSAYVTGSTGSANFPAANPLQAGFGGGNDAFVTKLNAAGSALVYSTYLGGSGGDFGAGIAVDGAGNASVTGWTTSTNFPTTNPVQASNGGFADAFVTKIDPAGSALVYSTYLGGSAGDFGYGIALGRTGNAYVTGSTDSANFPAATPIQGGYGGGGDAFVLSISTTAQISSATRFVPVTPCRIVDTRTGPAIIGGTSRDFVIPNGACGIPPTAAAYSFNVAVVPHATLGYLTLWPSGESQPLVATLNSLDGRVKSNAAIVPAGSSGAVSVFATDTTDVILDINGYYVPTTNTAALAFYALTPCRVAQSGRSVGRARPGRAEYAYVPHPDQLVRAARQRSGILFEFRRGAQGSHVGIHDRVADGTIQAPGVIAERSHWHRPGECSGGSGGDGRSGECVRHRRHRSGDRHQRLLRSPGAGRTVTVHGDALPGVGFAAARRNAAVQRHAGRECHGESLRHTRHGEGFRVQCHRGAARPFGVHHHVAARAIAAAGGDAERLRRSGHQQHGDRAHRHRIS
jgi:beta-propeller repeat-containing protein